MDFKKRIQTGIPSELPLKKERDPQVSHAPKRKDILSIEEKQRAIRNAFRYFPTKWHSVLAAEFAEELQRYGRIY
ncbi:MAG: urocanate hydratase, partial [Maribacter sp.]